MPEVYATVPETETFLSPAIIEALAIAGLPDVRWRDHDDLCDCTFQRVCQWTNPHLGTTHEERLCCIWSKLHEMFPGCSRDIPAWFDINRQEWDTEPVPWNGETDMPAAIWHRYLARSRGVTVAEARSLNLTPPKGRPRPEPIIFWLPWSGEYLPVTLEGE